MTYETESIAIQSRFNTLWAQATPVQWPNVAFESQGKTEWVRFSLLHETAVQAAMGGEGEDLQRHPGLVVLQVFVKPNTGVKRVSELADNVADIWRGAQFNGITMFTPSITHIGVVDGWYQVNVSCRFQRDEILTRSM